MSRLSFLIPLLGGCLLPFAFSPHCFFPLAIIAPLLLLFSVENISERRAFVYGFIFGLGTFGIGASWIFNSIYYYGNPNLGIAGTITALFVIVLALFPAFNAYLFNKFFKKQHWSRYYFAYPAGWSLFEWIRSWIFSGFPWLLLGQSQTNSFLSGYAPIVGLYGLSFIIVLCASLVYCIVIDQKRWLSLLLLIFIGSFGYLSNNIHWTKPVTDPIDITIVQGNIPLSTKWSPGEAFKSLDTYVNLSKVNMKNKLIVWPETAITLLSTDATPYLHRIDQLAKENNAAILTGIPIATNNDGDYQYYNGAIVLGDGKGEYAKRHLVPFGEYIPFYGLLEGFMQYFNFPMSNFSEGAMHQSLLTMKNIKIAPYICYEVAYPSIIRSDLPEANLLINISNDTWFGKSAAMYQQRQIAQFAALSTGRYIIISTNSGQTAIADPKGQLLVTAPIDKATTLTGTVYGMTGTTPWVFIGDTPIVLLLLGFSFLAYQFNRKL